MPWPPCVATPDYVNRNGSTSRDTVPEILLESVNLVAGLDFFSMLGHINFRQDLGLGNLRDFRDDR